MLNKKQKKLNEQMKLISIFSRIKTKCTDTMYSVVVKQSQTDRERGKERKEERKRERELVAP